MTSCVRKRSSVLGAFQPGQAPDAGYISSAGRGRRSENPELHFSLLDVQAADPGGTGKIPAAVDVLRADEKQDGYLHYCDCVRIGFVARMSI